MSRRPLTPDERAFGAALGLVIADQRRKAKMTGQALADASHLSVDGLRKLETGRVPDPGFQTVFRLSENLGVTLDQLVKQVAMQRRTP